MDSALERTNGLPDGDCLPIDCIKWISEARRYLSYSLWYGWRDEWTLYDGNSVFNNGTEALKSLSILLNYFDEKIIDPIAKRIVTSHKYLAKNAIEIAKSQNSDRPVVLEYIKKAENAFDAAEEKFTNGNYLIATSSYKIAWGYAQEVIPNRLV